jgi:hypothetical protein
MFVRRLVVMSQKNINNQEQEDPLLGQIIEKHGIPKKYYYQIRYVNRSNEESEIEAIETMEFENDEQALEYAKAQLSVSSLEVLSDHESDELTTRLHYKTEYYDRNGDQIPDNQFEEFDEFTMNAVDYYIEIEKQEID